MAKHTIRQGECITSIVDKYGLFWETVWDHAQNAELKQQLQNPNVLQPGDELFIPDKEVKEENCAPEQKHRFRKKGIPAMLCLRLLDNDEPRADESYTLEVDGESFSGTTDAEGRLKQRIAPGAKQVKLLVGENKDQYILDLGCMDPVAETTGVQARLNNLGFNCGEVDGVSGPETKSAIHQFQQKYGLTESGEADSATRDKLVEMHGC
jgi:N-acetylmuramoyl-L-alanine amidase